MQSQCTLVNGATDEHADNTNLPLGRALKLPNIDQLLDGPTLDGRQWLVRLQQRIQVIDRHFSHKLPWDLQLLLDLLTDWQQRAVINVHDLP